MKTKLLKTIIGALAIGLSAITASAQTGPGPGPGPGPMSGLGADLKAIITEYRADMQELLAQRKAALEALRAAATEAERLAIREQLRTLRQEQLLEQRQLAKQIRDAIRARRDLHRTPPTG